MIDYLPAIMTLNLLAVIFYASYSLETSPIYKDKWKALIGTVTISLIGIPLIVVHMFNKGKTK
jgi:hypothetical protein